MKKGWVTSPHGASTLPRDQGGSCSAALRNSSPPTVAASALLGSWILWAWNLAVAWQLFSSVSPQVAVSQSTGPLRAAGAPLREEKLPGSLTGLWQAQKPVSTLVHAVAGRLLSLMPEAASQHGSWLSPERVIQERGGKRTQDRSYLLLEVTSHRVCPVPQWARH